MSELVCECGKVATKQHYLDMHQKTCKIHLDAVELNKPKETEVVIEIKETEVVEQVVVDESLAEFAEKEAMEDEREIVIELIEKVRKGGILTEDDQSIWGEAFYNSTGKSPWSFKCANAISLMIKVLEQNGYKK